MVPKHLHQPLVSLVALFASLNIVSSSKLSLINPLIGNTGDTPNGSGGMIPSVAPPFGMTRWVAQTHENYVSRTPYNFSDSDSIHGFIGTRQPAIWMGESGSVVVVPGFGERVKGRFEERGLKKVDGSESFGVGLYEVELQADEGEVKVEMSATSRVGHLRFTFSRSDTTANDHPYIIVQSSRPSTLFSVDTDVPDNLLLTYPHGRSKISPSTREICGYNSERQDTRITPTSTTSNADHFKGHFCARFDVDFLHGGFGIVQGPGQDEGKNETQKEGTLSGEGAELAAYARFTFPAGAKTFNVDVRVGTSFISEEQARANIDTEAHDGVTVQQTRLRVEEEWLEKIGRVEVKGGQEDDRKVFMTGVFHALQYPYEQHESGKYYSAYDNRVHEGESYTGYSIWDTFRAEWAFLILMAPERIPGMVRSMLQDYQEGGWLPMWKNIAETNIMVGTHADSLIAEAVLKGFREGFDLDVAWDAVWKDATEPPVKDHDVEYYDRQENVDYEVRAGLSSTYAEKGWVADDVHSESASRTLDYAYDDFAAAQLSIALNKSDDVTKFLLDRAMQAPFTLFNEETGFMEARNANGDWAGEDNGWTEGDKWAYSFDVVHDVPRLIEKRGGNESFVTTLDEHFDGGHNDHTNEPSHHIPYLYALAGAAAKTQEKVREIAKANYNNTPNGLSGNEDCGQMSAWYIFSAMGFYPVNPVSGEYIVGSPLFDEVTLHLPPHPYSPPDKTSPYYDQDKNSYRLTVLSPGAPTKPYVRSLTVNGKIMHEPLIMHQDIIKGGLIVFEMSDNVQEWGGGKGKWTNVDVKTGVQESQATLRHIEL